MSHETTLRPKVPLSESPILRRYREKTPGSARLHARAVGLIPDGITHVSRYLEPHPPFVTRAAASRKWDVDGNEYVDYVGGHGSLLLGHNHPAVVEAVVAQLARGTHYGASHELELEWAEWIRRLVPSAERIRFTNSGTEATHLALRVARAATGKPMVLRFAGHFHGWHDHVAFSDESAPGIVKALTEHILISPPGDSSAFQALCNQRDDIAAVLIEPTGATFGQVPVRSEFLAELRRETSRRGIVLIFDEVISGFRCSPGGAQGFYGVTPDLTTLAKILAGGFPGGALVGRADLLSVLQHRRTSAGLKLPDVPHPGTFNANPVSATAGIATLRLVEQGDFIDRANRAAAAIRDGFNAVIHRLGGSWCAYGEFSAFHVYPNPRPEPVSPGDIYAGKVHWSGLKGATPIELQQKVRAGFLSEGVDAFYWPGGLVSGVHGAEDVDRTVSAFERVLRMLADEGELA
jgi:glutamate-1-semialdehyde 2,1-aminomutase